jgi:hypothetical protein
MPCTDDRSALEATDGATTYNYKGFKIFREVVIFVNKVPSAEEHLNVNELSSVEDFTGSGSMK